MESTCQSVTLEDVIFINRRMYEAYGGRFVGEDNLQYPDALKYILSAIHESYFGRELFPGIVAKCVAVGSRIITRHIFHDGNKRTGLEVCKVLLEINGYVFIIDEDAQDKTLLLADNKVTEEEFLLWVSNRTVLVADFMKALAG